MAAQHGECVERAVGGDDLRVVEAEKRNVGAHDEEDLQPRPREAGGEQLAGWLAGQLGRASELGAGPITSGAMQAGKRNAAHVQRLCAALGAGLAAAGLGGTLEELEAAAAGVTRAQVELALDAPGTRRALADLLVDSIRSLRQPQRQQPKHEGAVAARSSNPSADAKDEGFAEGGSRGGGGIFDKFSGGDEGTFARGLLEILEDVELSWITH